MPEQLIERFADLDSYSAQSSTLALEFTAWILNVPSSIASERSLYRYLKESRAERKLVPNEDVEKAIEIYFDFFELLGAEQENESSLPLSE
ncbi:MAG TPA: hypothetical protein VK892_10365 [Pyrinomonadaceae bacterium]|nr:hypothetical protein [Pyrinomonadaceae bacterium]